MPKIELPSPAKIIMDKLKQGNKIQMCTPHDKTHDATYDSNSMSQNTRNDPLNITQSRRYDSPTNPMKE